MVGLENCQTKTEIIINGTILSHNTTINMNDQHEQTTSTELQGFNSA